ncbi:MAG: hypothetical protein AB8B79_09565 [Granulosicoccus sp.]
MSTVEDEPSYEANTGRLERRVIEWPHLAADSHYSRFHPVSAVSVRPFYEGAHPRIVFFTSKPPALDKALIEGLTACWQSWLKSGDTSDLKVYWSPIAELSNAADLQPGHVQVDHIQARQTFQGTRAAQAGEKELAYETIGTLTLHERAAIINKSDLVVTDNMGIAVDTVLSAVPLGTPSIAPEFSAVRSSFVRYLTHRDRIMVVKEQSQNLEHYTSECNKGLSTISSEQELFDLLTRHLKPSEAQVNTESDTELYVPIIKPCRPEEYRKNHVTSLNSRLHNGRRKWRKFRESPKRFLNDSQHWALKSVKGIGR